MENTTPLGQQLSWIFGIISNGLWLFVFIPQLYKNYKNKNGEAISLLLLLCLMLGDIFSVISAVAKNLNLVIIYSAVYHIVLDLIVICQILYYRYYTENQESPTSEEDTPLLDTNTYNEQKQYYSYLCLTLGELTFLITSSLFSIIASILIGLLPNKDIVLFMADILGWFATMIFISARVPQILLNYQRKSTQGLSLLSFIIINIANWCFLLSILILLYDTQPEQYLEYIKYNLQWIVGSGSTSIFDGIIFYQFYNYRSRRNIFITEN